MKITFNRKSAVRAQAYWTEITRELTETPEIDFPGPRDAEYKHWNVKVNNSEVQLWVDDELLFKLFDAYLNLAKKVMPIVRPLIEIFKTYHDDVYEVAAALSKRPGDK